jgi:hypothetical protein
MVEKMKAKTDEVEKYLTSVHGKGYRISRAEKYDTLIKGLIKGRIPRGDIALKLLGIKLAKWESEKPDLEDLIHDMERVIREFEHIQSL